MFDKCRKCGKKINGVCHAVRNYFPTYGYPHDTERFLCEKCAKIFSEYITEKYDDFFLAEKKK